MKTTIYSAEELKKIQNLELEALRELIRVCDVLRIEWFLIGGSALGAVRHQGFIPWDDDIDVGMMRNDYVKFLKQAPELLRKEYELQTPYNGKTNPYFYTKVRINGTKFVEYCNRNIAMHQGVYVDVFPFDEVPDDENANRKQFDSVQRWIRLFNLRQTPDVSVRPESVLGICKAGIRKVCFRMMKIINRDILLEILDCKMTKYNGTNQSCVACLNFPVRKTEYIKKDDLYPLMDYSFENISVKIPRKYDIYLSTHYGDYMKLPPEDQRYGHKPYLVELGDIECNA